MPSVEKEMLKTSVMGEQ